MAPLNNDSGKVQYSYSFKQPQRENSQIPNPTHTHTHTSKEVVTGPLTFKNAPRAVLHAAAVVWS